MKRCRRCRSSLLGAGYYSSALSDCDAEYGPGGADPSPSAAAGWMTDALTNAFYDALGLCCFCGPELFLGFFVARRLLGSVTA